MFYQRITVHSSIYERFLSFINGLKMYYSLRISSISMIFVHTVRAYKLTIHVTRHNNKTAPKFSCDGRLDF